MECQMQHGLDVRGVGPLDNCLPAEQCLSIAHLPIKEYDSQAVNFSAQVLAEAGTGPCIYHFHGLSPWSDQLAKNLKVAAIPYVFTSHGQLHFHGPVHGLKKFAYLNFLNPFIRDAGGLHFLTRREQQRSKYILPRWRKSLLVQPNLVQLPASQEVTSAVRSTLGIPPEAFVYIYLGRLDVVHKGLDFLVEAFASVSRDDKSALVMIGPDFAGGRQFLEQLASKLGCAQRVHFLGSQVGPIKWSYLKMADAFVSPSRWEACSIAQAEAIGFGLPTVVSDEINIAPEMLANHAALVAPLKASALAGAMQRLMQDEALRKSLSASGRRWVAEAFSFENAGPRFTQFYRQVLQPDSQAGSRDV